MNKGDESSLIKNPLHHRIVEKLVLEVKYDGLTGVCHYKLLSFEAE